MIGCQGGVLAKSEPNIVELYRFDLESLRLLPRVGRVGRGMTMGARSAILSMIFGIFGSAISQKSLIQIHHVRGV